MTDDEIIESYWRREERAIRESDAKYGRYLFSIADHILYSREDSEECVNDTWLRAWRAIPPARPAKLKLYFAKITRNLALSRYAARNAGKRGGGEVALILDELSEVLREPDEVESEYMAKELAKAVNLFVHTLSERECNIFVRRYFYSEEIPEIAERYGISARNVTVTLSRTRGKLRQYLEKEGLV